MDNKESKNKTVIIPQNNFDPCTCGAIIEKSDFVMGCLSGGMHLDRIFEAHRKDNDYRQNIRRREICNNKNRNNKKEKN